MLQWRRTSFDQQAPQGYIGAAPLCLFLVPFCRSKKEPARRRNLPSALAVKKPPEVVPAAPAAKLQTQQEENGYFPLSLMI